MSGSHGYRDSWINPRLKIAAPWASMLFVFVYVDVFSLYRADVRADLEEGELGGLPIGQGFLLGVVVYVAIPSVMVFLSLVLPVRAARLANLVIAVIYIPTIVGGAIGESGYFVVGSAIEIGLLAGIVYYAWTWPPAETVAAAELGEAGGHPS